MSVIHGPRRLSQASVDAPDIWRQYPPAQPHQSPETLARVAGHARSVVEAEGALEWPEGLVEAVARGMFDETMRRRFEAPLIPPPWPPMKELAWEWRQHALAALRAAHDWRAEMDGRGV